MSPGRVVTLLVLCWVSLTPAWTQRYAGLLGQVLDPSSAGIADAVVTVVDEDTGFRRQVLSESDGMYAVGAVMLLIPAIMVNFDPREIWQVVEWADGEGPSPLAPATSSADSAQ